MGELQQLRAAIFDLTEQIRTLNEGLSRPTNRIGLQVDRLANLVEIIDNIPREIVMRMDQETRDAIDDHRVALDNYLLDR